MIGISGCLGGVFCRYDGGTQEVPQLQAMVQKGEAVMICPEVMGGLPTPREPAEIIGGDGFAVWRGEAKVMNRLGEDVTDAFKRGSIKAYQQLQELGISHLVLKERSPSCGSQQIYDGSFSGAKKTGVGVATAYFLQQGLVVLNENNWQEQIDGD